MTAATRSSTRSVFYSDDRGQTWNLGGVTEAAMDECEVVELADKSLLLCMRNYRDKNRRAFATSSDAGLSWSSPVHHEQVYCPTCQASIQRLLTTTRGRQEPHPLLRPRRTGPQEHDDSPQL